MARPGRRQQCRRSRVDELLRKSADQSDGKLAAGQRDVLDHQLRLITGVGDVRVEQPAPHEIRLIVVLAEYDWDVRELVDDFARAHVHDTTVLLAIVDVADVRLPLSA